MALAEEVLGHRPEAPGVDPGTGEHLVQQCVEMWTDERGWREPYGVCPGRRGRQLRRHELDTLRPIGKARSGATSPGRGVVVTVVVRHAARPPLDLSETAFDLRFYRSG